MARDFRETPQTAGGGRMTRQSEMGVDLKMASHSLGQVIEQIEGAVDAGIAVTRADLIRMLTLLSSDLGLVQRTIDGVARRVR